MRSKLFFLISFYWSCSVLHPNLKSPEYKKPDASNRTEFKYELLNWRTIEKSEIGKKLIESLRTNTGGGINYGIGGENSIQILIEEFPGNRLISSNFMERPGLSLIQFLNRIVSIATFTIFPFRMPVERTITINLKQGSTVKKFTRESNYDFYFGLGALLLKPWSDRDYVVNDMDRITKEFLIEAGL